MKNLKKILVISCDPDFSQKILELTKGAEIEIILANGLSEGQDLIGKEGKEGIEGVIIEYSAGSDQTVLSVFLSRPILKQIPVLLAAKEKRFLSDFSGENILKCSFDEIDIGVQRLLEK